MDHLASAFPPAAAGVRDGWGAAGFGGRLRTGCTPTHSRPGLWGLGYQPRRATEGAAALTACLTIFHTFQEYFLVLSWAAGAAPRMASLVKIPGTRAVLLPVGRFTPRPGRAVFSIVRGVLDHTTSWDLLRHQVLDLHQEGF